MKRRPRDIGTAAPKVLGLDLSLTCTGLAGNGWTDTIEPVKRGAAHRDRKDKTRDAQLRTAYNHERLSAIHRSLRTLLPADLVVMEGLAFDAHDTDRQQAGLSWNVRHFLWTHDVPYALVPPMVLKSFVTGDGWASKDAVKDAIADWLPWFDGGHDEADAAGLMAMGYAHLGLPLGPLLGHQVTALGKSAWPEQARPVVALDGTHGHDHTDDVSQGPDACPSCGRPGVVGEDLSIKSHDVLGLASPCDAPPSLLPTPPWRCVCTVPAAAGHGPAVVPPEFAALPKLPAPPVALDGAHGHDHTDDTHQTAEVA